VGLDLPEAALPKPAGLFLSKRYPAQRRAHHHAKPVPIDLFGIDTGILKRKSRSGHTKLRKPIHALA
jgi:hypothetical protein